MLLSASTVQRTMQCLAVGALFVAINDVSAAEKTISGKEIFAREWQPNDPRSHGGDGLGPVFNDTSCVACHNQGGVGGGGPASKNVDIVTAISNFAAAQAQQKSLTSNFVRGLFGLTPSTDESKAIKRAIKMESERLAKIHPGFRTARSVVLHRFGVDPKYAPFRHKLSGIGTLFGFGGQIGVSVTNTITIDVPEEQQIKGKFQDIQKANQEMLRVRQELGNAVFTRRTVQGGAQLLVSQRNPIALFGAGLIDSISNEAIEAQAKKKFPGFPAISGRVARLRDGRIGRFGWKAQKATLYDFTMTACAVELGLNVPDHPQSGNPNDPKYKPAGFDLNKKETDALVDYLKALPAPIQEATKGGEAKYIAKGHQLFSESGCANCHVEKMDQVAGIYSDLLVHDMGDDLGDTGDYGVFIPESPSEEEFQAQQEEPLAKAGGKSKKPKGPLGADRLEWRTAPLWGLRDSGPYMHDGRAQTIEQAIAFHGGEGKASASRYFMLKPAERQQVLAFLKSLKAPEAKQVASIEK